MVVEEAVAAVAAAGVTRDGRETVAAAGYATESPVSTLVSPPSSKRRRCDGMLPHCTQPSPPPVIWSHWIFLFRTIGARAGGLVIAI